MAAIMKFDVSTDLRDQLLESVEVVVGILPSDKGKTHSNPLNPSRIDSQYPGDTGFCR